MRNHGPIITVVQRMNRRSFIDWIKYLARKIGWLLFISFPVIIAIFIAGPDAIRHIPKVPGAIYDTFWQVLYSDRLDKELNGKWTNQSPYLYEAEDEIKMELWVNKGVIDGTISSAAFKVMWGSKEMPNGMLPYPTVLLKGQRDGAAYKVEAFDFIANKYTKLALLTIWAGEELTESNEPLNDNNQLRIETDWHVSRALPESFLLFRKSN